MFEASTASIILSMFTSEATACVGVKPAEKPVESLAYAERTEEASAASIKLSPLTSPSLIVTTEAEMSFCAGVAVSLTLAAVTYAAVVHSEAAEAAVMLPVQSARASADEISFFALILFSFILGYPHLFVQKT